MIVLYQAVQGTNEGTVVVSGSVIRDISKQRVIFHCSVCCRGILVVRRRYPAKRVQIKQPIRGTDGEIVVIIPGISGRIIHGGGVFTLDSFGFYLVLG